MCFFDDEMWKNYLKAYITTVIFVILHSSLSAQVEDYPDTLRIDSSHQDLKMIVQEKNDTILIPIDSISGINYSRNNEWNPKKSWWMSAILPGLGQAHNRKYWKIPIIYGIFATSLYMIENNNFKYKIYKDAYAVFSTQGAPPWSPSINETQLKDRKNYYRRNRDLSIILGVVFYFMNIVDASVDANLMDFDISEDLSMSIKPQIKPAIINSKNTFGLKFVISLNN